jgi:hypothetical protein
MEFNTEFLQFSSLGASIYRLTVQMSVWLDKTGCRPEGGHRSSGRTTVRSKFRWKSFLFESRVRTVLPCRMEDRMFTASNFHIEASGVQTKRMVVQTVVLMHTISIFDTRSSRPCWLASERESISSGRLQRSSHICVLERNPERRPTEGRPDEQLNRPDRCKLEQFEASRHRERSWRESRSSGRMML